MEIDLRLLRSDHHDTEEEQDHDGPGVDDDLKYRHQWRTEKIEDDGKGKERGDKIDDGMHRMPFYDTQERGDNRHQGEEVEE
jgi:hypothetical protein